MGKVAELFFEELMPKFDIEGGATVTYCEEKAVWDCDYWGENLAIERQINLDQPFHFHVAFKQTGDLCEFLNPELKWRVEVLMEKMGKGEFELPEALRVAKMDFVAADPHNYDDIIIKIPRRQVTDPGVYRVVVMINLIRPNGHGPDPKPREFEWLPIAGFADIGWIQFYED